MYPPRIQIKMWLQDSISGTFHFVVLLRAIFMESSSTDVFMNHLHVPYFAVLQLGPKYSAAEVFPT